MKLNLGCGNDIKKGYVNLDSKKLKGVNVTHNLEKFPYPFKNNELDYVIAYHIIEHLPDMIKTMEEIP